MKCEKCGNKLKHKIEGMCSILYCDKCGYQLTTGKDRPELLDETVYSIELKDNPISTEIIKSVSEITGKNFIEIKSALKNNGSIYVGKAVDIIEKRAQLDKKSIKYSISPEFKY